MKFVSLTLGLTEIFVESLTVIISILSLIGIVVISLISNQILLLSFENLLNVPIYEMNILVLKPGTIIGDILIVWVISIISSLLPLIYLRKPKQDEK